MSTAEDRKAIADELARIAKANGGLLTPDDVVAEASSKTSILHGEFEWDNKKAAHERRLDQARALIRSVRVIFKTERTTVSTIGYVRDPDVEPNEQGYVAVASLIGESDRAHAALAAEFARAGAALRRARELALVLNLDVEFDVAAEAVESTRTRVEVQLQERRQ